MKKLHRHIIILVLLLTGCRSSILDDPTTTIGYTVPEYSHVTVSIENSYNTVVAVLVDADLQPGHYNALFNSGGLQEGVYYYTLECRGINSDYYLKTTKRILLIK